MTRWYSVESADAGFFSSAPRIFRYEKRFEASARRVWQSMTSDASLSAWGPAVSRVDWLNPRPFGVGTRREVVLAPGIARVRERFSRWDDAGELGYSFEVYEASVPFFLRFAEDYTVTPDGEDASTFIWTVALEPKGAFTLPVTVLAPVIKAAFGRLASDGQRYFARQADSGSQPNG